MLWAINRRKHLAGTREWAFADVFEWLDDAKASQLFLLLGGGGTGKTVLSAELLHRLLKRKRVAGWHFCRHDNKEQSTPANLLRSLAVMLCHSLKDFKLEGLEGLDEALVSADPKLVFEALLAAPLAKVAPPSSLMLIIIDALDEIPKEGQKLLLGLIANQLSTLPSWLRLFVTSREEPLVMKALNKFGPHELRADEVKNRADVDVYLRTILGQFVTSDVRMVDIEADVKRTFGVDFTGKLGDLQEPMERSREIYREARTVLESLPGFQELLEYATLKPNAKQASDHFETVYAQAREAQELLTGAVAAEWEPDADPKLAKFLKHPVSGTIRHDFIELADNPGVKGSARALEKVKNDYEGHANKLKDLARLTLRFTKPDKLNQTLKRLIDLGFKIVILKNKYASPTPLGYCDFNLVLAVTLKDSTEYLCEVQLNLVQMLDAKASAHDHYEIIRKEVPKRCEGTGVDPEKLEAFITGRLNNSALDGAVAAVSNKSGGLFLYAFLLAQHLEAEVAAGRDISFESLDSLPTGLADVYEVNFWRAFPLGASDPGWMAARPLVELIAAAMQPITVEMAADLLGWSVGEQERVLELTALLFPVRDGLLHVFHKTIIDWLTGEITEGSSLMARSAEFAIERRDGHTRFAAAFAVWRDTKAGDATNYWLQHGIVHLCRVGGERATEAVEVFSSDLELLRQRVDAGHLAVVAKDYLELRRVEGVELVAATQMKSFVGKYRDVLQREGGTAVLQLATQQPDESVVFRALGDARVEQRLLVWRNKSQRADPCVATLAHTSAVKKLAVSRSRVVGAAGKVVYVYDAATNELLEELQGESDVEAVAIFEPAVGDGLIVAGFKNGTLKAWGAHL